MKRKRKKRKGINRVLEYTLKLPDGSTVQVTPEEEAEAARQTQIRWIRQVMRYAGLLAFLVALVGCQEQPPKPIKADNQAEAVAILPQPEFVQGDPWQASLDNAAKADATYTGKRAQVTAKVSSVIPLGDGFGLSLTKGNPAKYNFCSCWFDGNSAALQDLTKGDTVTVEGIVTDWDNGGFSALTLKHCKIVARGE